MDNIYLIDIFKTCDVRGAKIGIPYFFKGFGKVLRRERRAIMKFYPLVEHKTVKQRGWIFKRFGQMGNNVELMVNRDQAVKNELTDSLRISIERETGIEVGGLRWNCDDKRVSWGYVFSRATEKDDTEEKKKEVPLHAS